VVGKGRGGHPASGAIRHSQAVDRRGALEGIRGSYQETGFGEVGYFHRPDEMPQELAETPFALEVLIGLEGPAWLLDSLADRWEDPEVCRRILDVARLVESEPSLAGLEPASAGHRAPVVGGRRWRGRLTARTMSSVRSITSRKEGGSPGGAGRDCGTEAAPMS